MSISVSDVQSVIDTDLDVLDIQKYIVTANLIVSEELASSGLSSSRRDQIAKYLAAHFCTLKEPQGRLTELDTDGTRQKFAGSYGSGLRSSPFGQTALMLDTTGTLAAIADDQRPTMQFDAWFEDYDTGEFGTA